MADKEATVYIVDLGESMGDCHNGRTESDLDFSMKYVWDKLTNTVAANRKTWTVGVIGLNTDDTNNPQANDDLDGYDHISVLHELGPITRASLKSLKESLQPTHVSGGDAISAIVVATNMIEVFTKKLKYKRRIVLVTNGESPIDDESADEVATKINECGIELVVIGVDFDDPEYGFKEEDKSRTKRNNEEILRKLVEQCKEGLFGTMAQAVEETAIPRIKPVRPFKAYDGPLTLGDPENYQSAISFHVERYFKTKRATPPSASTVVSNLERGGLSQTQTLDEDVEMGGTGFSGVKQLRSYKVDDPTAPGGKRDVDIGELAKGYEYGRSLVPFGTTEMDITKFQTKKSFTILGFVPASSYREFLNMGETGVIVAQRHNEEAELGLSALIHKLWDLESYAVARYVQKDGAQPQILLLKPNPAYADNFECLYDVPLPFAEDVRTYQFPPLDKVLTVTGNVLKEHRLLPSQDLKEAMSDFVDAMDLSNYEVDENGNPVEFAPIDELYNPTIHRINQAIRARAVEEDAPIGPPAEILMRHSKPPQRLIDKAKSEIAALIDAAEVKKVPEKAQGRRGRKETVKPLSGLDIDALLSDKKRTTISSENAIPEFKQMLATAADDTTVESAVKQMGEIVRKLVRDSFANVLYARAAENLRVMREEMIAFEMPGLYNKFMAGFKKSLLSGELNGDRREMWFRHVVAGKLGLITKEESEVSEVTVEEAKVFLSATS